MKKVHIIFFLTALAGLLGSCEEKLESPNFGVTPIVTKTVAYNEDGEEFNAYDVRFLFSGNAKNIVFYSGESGSRYRYTDRYVLNAITKVQFTTNFNGGNVPNALRIMVSNDFKPEYVWTGNSQITTSTYTAERVKAATWIDVTQRFNLPGNQLFPGAQTSGEAVFTEFHRDAPLFIGFRFDADNTAGGANLGQWVFSQFQIWNEYDDATPPLYYIDNVLNYNWKSVDLADPVSFAAVNNTLTLTGSVVAESIRTMVISPPFYPSLVDTEKGLVIKSIEERVPEYTHRYVDPRTESIHAVFVATNSLYGDIIQEVKELEIVFK